MTKLNVEVEGVEANPEYEAGYNAFMRRCAYYCLAHAGESWQNFWDAGEDDQPETPDYVEGWNTAKSRMYREVQLDLGLTCNPRCNAAVQKLLKKHPGRTIRLTKAGPVVVAERKRKVSDPSDLEREPA